MGLGEAHTGGWGCAVGPCQPGLCHSLAGLFWASYNVLDFPGETAGTHGSRLPWEEWAHSAELQWEGMQGHQQDKAGRLQHHPGQPPLPPAQGRAPPPTHRQEGGSWGQGPCQDALRSRRSCGVQAL